jgi:hypothetical protein
MWEPKQETYPGILLFWHKAKDYGVLIACDGTTYKFSACRLRDIFKSSLKRGIFVRFTVDEEMNVDVVCPAGDVNPTDVQILEDQLQNVIWQRESERLLKNLPSVNEIQFQIRKNHYEPTRK